MGRRTELVAMRDGIRLATDVYRPEGTGPSPAVLIRTPYDRKIVPEAMLEHLLAAGCVVVMQDWRGRYESEGRQLLFTTEAADGYDTCAWLCAQPWCNGRIGTWGSSALGMAQTIAAPLNPPGLRCQQIDVASGSAYTAAYQGGAFREALVLPYLVICGYEPQNLNLQRDHPLYDDLWRQLDADAAAEAIAVPALHTGGWFDIFCQPTLDTYRARQHRSRAAGRHKLVIGPWVHGRSVNVGELTFPYADDLPAPWNGTAWLDAHLRDEPNGIHDQPAVTYYLMGDPDDPDPNVCCWRTAEDWPVPCTPTTWHLRADGGLSPEPPAAAERPRTFRYDPLQPVRTIGGCEMNIAAGPRDQRPVEDRPDVLCYTSDPLAGPLAITGRVTAVVWIASSAVDTDVCVKLCDVYPDGRSMLVCDGIQRLRYRPGPDGGRCVEPDTPVRCEVDLWSTALVFGRGHRLRVSVTSSNYPRFDVNPNTGRWSHEEREPVAADNTIFTQPGRASVIVLPVVP